MAAARDTLILGTAGHVDHGKTTLVRALTGVDTDRLPEEKARGITIELGFAPLALGPGLALGVVDVPGHEALVRTMVAGTTGIDLVLLVVAADEGAMPQTREHVAILDLLGVETGVVALAKCDLVAADVAELAEAEVRALLAGTSLAEAESVRVSAASGAGIAELRAALARAAQRARARTPRSGPPRLWVDRCFEMRGFGPVVTGTLTGAPLAAGDAVELFPSGGRARVRGLQSFGASLASLAPGARCAMNLQGVELAALERGLALSAPGALAPTHSFDAELRWLASAPEIGRDPLACELLAGTASRRARIAPLGAEPLAPGGRGFARIHLDDGALPLLPGDRFVARGFAAGATLGGGRVLDVAPPRRRRSDPVLAQQLAILAGRDAAAGVALRIDRAGYGGIERSTLAQQTGLAPAELDAALARPGLAALEGGAWVSERVLGEAAERARAALRAFHAAQPLQPGMPRGALRGALPLNAARGLLEAALARLAAAGKLALEHELVRATDFAPQLAGRQRELADRARSLLSGAGLAPPTLRELGEGLAASAAELRDVLAHLEREGALVRAPGDLWFARAAVDALRARVIEHLERHASLETTAYKELIGTTRKFAVPLMELFDAEHTTLRRGDVRIRARKSPSGDVPTR